MGLLTFLSARVEERDGLVHAAAIGQRAGGHDPALGDDLGPGGRGGELTPAFVDLPPPSLSPVAVHEHRVLLDGPAELDERLQLLGRGLVVPDAVLRETEQLAHARRVRQRVPQRSEQT